MKRAHPFLTFLEIAITVLVLIGISAGAVMWYFYGTSGVGEGSEWTSYTNTRDEYTVHYPDSFTAFHCWNHAGTTEYTSPPKPTAHSVFIIPAEDAPINCKESFTLETAIKVSAYDRTYDSVEEFRQADKELDRRMFNYSEGADDGQLAIDLTPRDDFDWDGDYMSQRYIVRDQDTIYLTVKGSDSSRIKDLAGAVFDRFVPDATSTSASGR